MAISEARFGLVFESHFLVSKIAYYSALELSFRVFNMLRQSLGKVYVNPGRNIPNSNAGVLYSTVSFSMKTLSSCRQAKSKEMQIQQSIY